MKLYYTGPGVACIVYLPAAGHLTAQVTLRQEGLDYPDAVASTLLADYPALVSKTLPPVQKLEIPKTKKGGEN